MKHTLIAAIILLGLPHSMAFARGVSPYLPIGINPEMERKIERVLLLADKPLLTRPIAAATVLDALPAACAKDPQTCRDVRRYLDRFMGKLGITDASVEIAASSGAEHTIPNRYGLTTESSWEVAARGYYQPFDHALLSLGAVAYEDEVIPEGSMVSLGFDRAQLDLGYRAHWLSPFSDSSMLIGTEAATMPSITLSNYVPLTRWGIQYEAFVASMSESKLISFQGDRNTGRPRLAGIHLSTEPASGWALGVNRLLQYGGAGRPGSFSDLLHAFFDPSGYDNTDATLTSDEQFGNQLASITSTMIFPGRVPFSVYFEYAGEDTSAGKNYLLGNSALSAGIHFPQLWRQFDLTVELSEWQNGWYVNDVYGDGLTNKGHVIGHWGGDNRQFGNSVGARSAMVRLGWRPAFGGEFEARARTLSNEEYYNTTYQTAYDGTLSYSRPFGYVTVGAGVYGGRDVFGESFTRVAAFFRLNDLPGSASRDSLDEEDGQASWPTDKSAEVFVEAGASQNHVRIDLDAIQPAVAESKLAPHVAIGVRRAVSDRSDLGARLEFDEVNNRNLVSVRAIDYRYRFDNPLALSVFIGASRYDLATPAYGLYYGLGVQWRNLFPTWDIGVDVRRANKVARDHLLNGDPSSAVRPDSFYDITGYSLVLTKRF
jgi:hypothetical protein